jgi:SP family myo-inositol transporter-like MFS transporter 13
MAADSTGEPLMRHEHDEDTNESEDMDISDVSLLLEKNLRHPGLFVWLLTFSAGISGLLFGCLSLSSSLFPFLP